MNIIDTPLSPAAADSTPLPSSLPSELKDLNGPQLRELYENEEIGRFLRLFSTYVTEVKALETLAETSVDSVLSGGAGNAEEWVRANKNSIPEASLVDDPPAYHSISEEVAQRCLIPFLPPPRTPQEFTFTRFRLATQRLYLAIIPTYIPFFVRLYRLAKWQDRKTSLAYCIVFWLLWWRNLLLAAFLFKLLLVLLKHRLFPYPSLSDLEKHREEIHHADIFSKQLSERLSAASLGAQEVWRFGRLMLRIPKEAKVPKGMEEAWKQPGDHLPSGNSADLPILQGGLSDSKDVEELKRLGLYIVTEIADLHERIRNIFIWRKPSSSYTYFWPLVLFFVGAVVLPTRFIVKPISGATGFLYWHVTPVIAALDSRDISRLPSPLADIPTDADYAMELISQRADAGLEIEPFEFAKQMRVLRPESTQSARDERSASTTGASADAKSNQLKDTSTHRKDVWSTIDTGKSLLQDPKRFFGDAQAAYSNRGTSSPRSSSSVVTTTHELSSGKHIFPAQHSSGPGLITITPTTFYFTPMTSLNPKVTISAGNIRGVKKAGFLGGMELRWVETGSNGSKIESLEKFVWIGRRDELFTRVVSMNSGTKWLRA